VTFPAKKEVTSKTTHNIHIQSLVTNTNTKMDQQQQAASDARIKSDEAAMRRVANSGGVGAFAVAQAAPGGRRQGPRVRRSASARRRARLRAGLEVDDNEENDPNSSSATTGAGSGGVSSSSVRQSNTEMEINPDSLIAADVEMDTYGMDMEDGEGYETLGFWQLDKTDKFICGGICVLVVALIVILGVGMSAK
jgi:hypothetical protein